VKAKPGDGMKRHLPHLLMCLPMLLVAAFFVLGGAGFAALLPVLGCMLMMGLMMSVMGGHSHGDSGR
jgi:hypothetical protein